MSTTNNACAGVGSVLTAPRAAIAVRAHRSSYPDPVRFRRDDTVVLGNQDPEFPGWIRVADRLGRSGWAPEALLDNAGGTHGTAIEDYDATELDVSPGDRLTVHRELAGWIWVCNEMGQYGWIPASAAADAGS